MKLQAQIFIILFAIFGLILIVNMIRKRHLELKYVLIWMACDVVLVIVTCFPYLLGVMSEVLGIQSPMNMVFFLGLLFVLMIIFSLTVVISRLTAKVRRMAQEIAFLTERIENVREKAKEER